MKRAHVLISGRVQGVFFRANTIKEARELGLTGWVKNTGDKVEAVFEGEENKIKEILLWCNQGPKLAQVENVEVKYEVPTGEFKEFSKISSAKDQEAKS